MDVNSQLKAIGNIMGTKKSGYIIRFGNHKGDDISDVPLHYLKWCIKNLENNGFVKEAEKEVERRK